MFHNRNVDFLNTNKRSISEDYSIKIKSCESLVVILRSLMKSGGYFNGESETKPNNLRKNTIVNEDPDSQKVESNEEDNINNNLIGVVAVEIYDRKQKVQEEVENGILKFNQSAKKGIHYLVSLGHIDYTPKSVSDFFRQYQNRLDKTAVGEYLGREKEYENGFCLKVLHEYVDSMDFTNMKFDEAIRFYLSGFRLPGEAQKIDRIMEKFAERYYLQNRGIFPSADMAFILAFSTIMLQTNLHNPAIRDDKRMTKDQFIKQNKGISNDGDLPDDMLREIYDRILAEPISLNQEEKISKKQKKDEQNFMAFPISSEKKRKEAYNDERKEMIRISEAMFRQKVQTRRSSTFIRSDQTLEAYTRPMFELAWPPMLSVFSQILEQSDDQILVRFCLDGFQYAIKLSSRMDLNVARNAFINSLCKFTTLDAVRTIQTKHIEAIKVLLMVALNEGDYLIESWNQILLFISRLSRLQLFAERVHTDDIFFNSQSTQIDFTKDKKKSIRNSFYNSSNNVSSDPFKIFTGPTKAETLRLLEESNAEFIMTEIDNILIDKIFFNSQNLSSESIYYFIKALCSVSLLEISSSGAMNDLRGKDISFDLYTPRVFSLQKIVEVADCNMHIRSRISWAKIWNELALHFTQIGIHDNYALAMFAVDSLKQLSIKFLQKDELSNFNFQRLFLKPFEIIITQSISLEIKELVLRCLDIMIKACSVNIRSGWKSIFAVFEVAAAHDKYEIARIAFEIIERLMNEYFELLIFDFVELMNCLVAFVSGIHNYLSLSALSYLSKCADLLAKGLIEKAVLQKSISELQEHSNPDTVPKTLDEDNSVFRLWWPLLLGLSVRVADSRLQIRKKALEVLTQILEKYGNLFSKQTWSVIFKGVLLPMIDSAKTDYTKQPESSWPTENPNPSLDPFSWIATMALEVLSTCSNLYLKFKTSKLTDHLLSDLLNVIKECICQEIESLARIGLRSLSNLFSSLMGLDSQLICTKDMDLICDILCSCLLKNLITDFGDIGSFKIQSRRFFEISSKILEIPHSSESMTDMKAINNSVITPYGEGEIVKV